MSARFPKRVLGVLFACSLGAMDLEFTRDIEPLLRSRCQVCHGATQQVSGLRLDSAEGLLKGGYSGPAIKPGDSGASRLIRLVSGLEEKLAMPPAGPRLTAAEIARLRAWIDQGAPSSSTLKAPAAANRRATPSHWSFQPIQRPAAPNIDHFINERLRRENVEPSPEAPKQILIRRVSFDLTGLPPTPAEVGQFLADTRPDAYERLVDRLLASPHYGEKWARWWLDQARYADSDGYEKDRPRPHAWRWRQWVIDALNRDMPFDRFTIEQIAGDLLPGAGIEQRVATGFHRNTLTNREGGINVEQFRAEQVIDRAATVGVVWMGLTFGCAQCHDHKFDPITQKEFYQLYAFFNNADEQNIDAPLEGETGPYLRSIPGYRGKREELLARYRVFELQPAWEARMKEARAQPGKWTDWDHAYDAFQKYLDNADDILDTPPAARTWKDSEAIADHFVINYHRVITKELRKELKYDELRKQLDELRASFPALSEAQTLAERQARRRTTHIHLRGDWRKQGLEVAPGTPAFLHPAPPDPERTRLTLARWLVSRDNPLTARVIVNRIWQDYFGRGLVRTSGDFGVQGEKPSHPELLDWLAARFMDTGWRMKDLHRLIVTSAAYRRSSQSRPDVDTRDPANALLARQARLRLPAEYVRDAALTVSGLLDPAIGGHSVRPPIPKGVVELGYASGNKWVESAGRDRYRRGLYVHFQRTTPYPQLMNFDAPDANASACSRERSNTPLQALNLLNDPVFVEAAQAAAASLLRQTPLSSLPERIDHLFRVALGRAPDSAEREWVGEYYRVQTRIFERDAKAAADFFSSEVEGHSRVECAAWAAVASAILNTDEFITRE